jgi:hypothetical protein
MIYQNDPYVGLLYVVQDVSKLSTRSTLVSMIYIVDCHCCTWYVCVFAHIILVSSVLWNRVFIDSHLSL